MRYVDPPRRSPFVAENELQIRINKSVIPWTWQLVYGPSTLYSVGILYVYLIWDPGSVVAVGEIPHEKLIKIHLTARFFGFPKAKLDEKLTFWLGTIGHTLPRTDQTNTLHKSLAIINHFTPTHTAQRSACQWEHQTAFDDKAPLSSFAASEPIINSTLHHLSIYLLLNLCLFSHFLSCRFFPLFAPFSIVCAFVVRWLWIVLPFEWPPPAECAKRCQARTITVVITSIIIIIVDLRDWDSVERHQESVAARQMKGSASDVCS